MQASRLLSFVLSALVFLAGAAGAQQIAATPPMGWNSWNFFALKVTDKDIRTQTDMLVSSGMRDAGYVYVNIDDAWEGKRDAKGFIHSNSKFPDMKALADYVHSKGLKLGIYSSPGPTTCGAYEGSYGHEYQDAQTYAEWGVDLLKYDLCSYQDVMLEKAPGDPKKRNAMMRAAYETMHQALVKTGRPIVYSLCQYGDDSVWEWAPSVGGTMWRTTPDLHPEFNSIAINTMYQAGLAKYASPGHWNDPDMLEVGNGKLTPDENRLHMTMWAMLAAPLIAGNDLTTMSQDTKAVLMNREVIAIDQDRLGKGAERILTEGPVEIWARPLSDGGTALAVINFGHAHAEMRNIQLHLPELGFAHGADARDIWAGKDLGKIGNNTKFAIPKHGVVLLKLSPSKS